MSGAGGGPDDITPDEVRAALREYFADRPGLTEVRRNRDESSSSDGGFDREGWSVLARQVGLIEVGAPEQWGGQGLGLPHLVSIAEECGAALYPGPVRATLLLAASLAGADVGSVPGELRSAIEDFFCGAAIVGIPTRLGTAGPPEFRDGRLSGRVPAVTHGTAAGLVLCVAQTPEGPALAVAAPAACPTGVERIGLPSIDLATPLADVVLAEVPAVLLTAPGDGEALQRFRTVEALLLAAEQVGGGEGCLGAMVAYAKVREQFGTLIGTYQAIQHHCATTAISVAAARALVAAAADAAAGGDDRAARQLTLLARADAADAFTGASSTLIQVSGGIGFTWEHDAHLFFRRARATTAIGGTPAQFRDRAVAAGCLDLLVQAVA
ncbi:acyl-CoA dehydrogenase family protein [Gordonia sp. NPDC003424]